MDYGTPDSRPIQPDIVELVVNSYSPAQNSVAFGSLENSPAKPTLE